MTTIQQGSARLATRCASIGVFLFGVFHSAFAVGDAYTVPLGPSIETGAGGNYLSAPFDFGTQFSQIDSVKLEFTMPAGFSGGYWSTGNSSGSQFIKFQIHDQTATLDLPLSTNQDDDTYSSLWDISPGVPVELLFGPNLVSLNEERRWPAFWLNGSGKVDIVVESGSYRHPINGPPESYSSSFTWLTPIAITSGTLTVVGTPLPEPGSISLSMILAAAAMVFWGRCR